ncbi:hypothetical protein BVY00_01755 [bacterium G20]|nr:hypothetical protein BVY00_01755 [bacterium G20]
MLPERLIYPILTPWGSAKYRTTTRFFDIIAGMDIEQLAFKKALAQQIFKEHDPRRVAAEQEYAVAKLLLSL